MNKWISLTLLALSPALAQTTTPPAPAPAPAPVKPYVFNRSALPDLGGEWRFEQATVFFDREKDPSKRVTLKANVELQEVAGTTKAGDVAIRAWFGNSRNNSQSMYGNVFTGEYRLGRYSCTGAFRAVNDPKVPDTFVAICGPRNERKTLPVKLVRVPDAPLPK